MQDTPLSCVELAPPGRHTATVIWLHGLGADGNDFVPAIPYLGLPEDHGIRFVFPTAQAIPVTINAGMVMPAWYDIRDLDLGAADRNDAAGLLRSVEAVRRLLADEIARGVASERIVMAGFSQGGAVAVELALTHPQPLAGLIALSTYVVDRDRIRANRTAVNGSLPILQCHGQLDPMVPFAFGEAARAFLTEAGHSVQWSAYPIGHEVSAPELVRIGAFLADVLAGDDA